MIRGGRFGKVNLSKGAAAPYGVKSASAAPLRPLLAGEDTLYPYLEQLPPGRNGQRALIFRLSRLHRSHRRDKHQQIAANLLQETLKQFPGRLFALRNGDIVMVCKGIGRKAIDEQTELLRYLFNDDPLAREDVERADFCASFDLEVSFPAFLAALDEIREFESRRRRRGPERWITSGWASCSRR